MKSRIGLARVSVSAALGPQPVSGAVPPVNNPAQPAAAGWSFTEIPVAPKLRVGDSEDPLELQADQAAQRIVRKGSAQLPGAGAGIAAAPRIVHDVLGQSGDPLDGETRRFFEPRFQHDFSAVRVHTGPAADASARAILARAYTAGNHIVFGENQFEPRRGAGKELLAHELAHVVQRDGGRIHRQISMRDVGKGEHSGFARLPELVTRLNAVAKGLVFKLDSNNNLVYDKKPDGALTNFETQMQGFIDSGAVIPLRLTNHEGLLGNRGSGYRTQVTVDDWDSGYVDIDDLLASDDLSLQTALVHLLKERASTKNYAGRMGSFLDSEGRYKDQKIEDEFNSAHTKGLSAETQVLQDYFNDRTISFAYESEKGAFDRVWRNSRGDRICTRKNSRGGVYALTITVLLKDGKTTMTAAEYRDFLARQTATAKPPAPAKPPALANPAAPVNP